MRYTVLTVLLMQWKRRTSENAPAPGPAVLDAKWEVTLLREGEIPAPESANLATLAIQELVSDSCKTLNKNDKDALGKAFLSGDFLFTTEELTRRTPEAPLLATEKPSAKPPAPAGP